MLPTPRYGRRKVWFIIGPGTHNTEGPSYLSCVAPRTCFTPNLDHSFNVTRYHTFQETTVQQHAIATDSFNGYDLRRKREGRRVWSSGPQDHSADTALERRTGRGTWRRENSASSPKGHHDRCTRLRSYNYQGGDGNHILGYESCISKARFTATRAPYSPARVSSTTVVADARFLCPAFNMG